MSEAFDRTRMLLGSAAMEKLAASRIAVFGIGGVGGYVVEALVRSGVGALDLVDSDKVDITNLNRQIIATLDTVGTSKVEAARERAARINPACIVRTYPVFFLPETADTFDFSVYDYVVDAVDTVKAKLAIIERAKASGVPVISSMGAGNKLDPTAFEVACLEKTSVCPLAKVMRLECRKRGIRNVKVVYSKEPPRQPAADTGEVPQGSRRSVPGSAAFVPSAVGLIIASVVVKDLTGV